MTVMYIMTYLQSCHLVGQCGNLRFMLSTAFLSGHQVVFQFAISLLFFSNFSLQLVHLCAHLSKPLICASLQEKSQHLYSKSIVDIHYKDTG